MLTDFDKDVDKLARIANGYISEGVTYEEITTGNWFDYEVRSILDRYPEYPGDKERLKKFVAIKIKELMD